MTPLEELQDWLHIAQDDLRAAGLTIPVGPLGPGCFHCQQAAEKTSEFAA